MDAVNPWLDPSEVRHLAEQLLRPVAPAQLSAVDPGFSSSFVGYMSTSERQSPAAEEPSPAPQPPTAAKPYPIQQPIAAVAPSPVPPPPPAAVEHSPPQPTVPEPLPNAPEISRQASPQVPPAAPSRTRFLERIQIFRDWLAKNFRATDIFILDREGKVIFDESGHGRLHFMARNLALATRGSGNIHVKIGPASILEVIPCETPYGRIVLGAIVPESLPSNHVSTITEVLIQTASPA